MPTRPSVSGLHPISRLTSTAACHEVSSPPLPLPSHIGRSNPFMIPLATAVARGIMNTKPLHRLNRHCAKTTPPGHICMDGFSTPTRPAAEARAVIVARRWSAIRNSRRPSTHAMMARLPAAALTSVDGLIGKRSSTSCKSVTAINLDGAIPALPRRTNAPTKSASWNTSPSFSRNRIADSPLETLDAPPAQSAREHPQHRTVLHHYRLCSGYDSEAHPGLRHTPSTSMPRWAKWSALQRQLPVRWCRLCRAFGGDGGSGSATVSRARCKRPCGDDVLGAFTAGRRGRDR
jgi:hypothetical protein